MDQHWINDFMEFAPCVKDVKWARTHATLADAMMVHKDHDYRRWLHEHGVDGVFREWYHNGQLEFECTYTAGKLNGPYLAWYANGQLEVERTYAAGQLTGLYRTRHPNGQMSKEC